jgi:hypothetical protein
MFNNKKAIAYFQITMEVKIFLCWLQILLLREIREAVQDSIAGGGGVILPIYFALAIFVNV